MNILKQFLLLILLCGSISPSWATLKLNIGIIHKKGIDKGLVLVSEIHSLEEVIGGEPIILKVKNGLTFDFEANYREDLEGYGPSDLIGLKGKILGRNGKILKFFEEADLNVRIGEKRILVHNNNKDQLIEISIQPKIF